jgi:hypothetical protein
LQTHVKKTTTMAAVARRTQMNGTPRDGTPNSNNNEHDLDDLDASILQTLIAKRVLLLDNALRIFGNLADATGAFLPYKLD